MSESRRNGGVEVELEVPATLRDGVTLRANVFRPSGGGPAPVLLHRTPYGKDNLETIAWTGIDPVQVASRGFVVVVQDTRGRFASDGEWEPFRHEIDDGYDSVEWAAALPGSNGRVGMYGGSYHGITQWLAAVAAPPSLAAISPAFTWSEPLDGLFARGGAVELGLALIWALGTGFDYLARLGLDEVELRRRLAGAIHEWDHLDSNGYWSLPVSAGTPLARQELPDMGGIGTLRDPGLADACRVTDLDRVTVPSLHIAGWYDIFTQGTLDNYEAIAARRGDARLVVGPWTHRGFTEPIGERTFGLRSGRDEAEFQPGGSLIDYQLSWNRRQLVDDSDVDLPETPARIFVMGRNEWRDEPAWPLARAVDQLWFLQSDGSLAPSAEGADSDPSQFAYDPEDPAPTVGGNGVLWTGYPSGPYNQSALEARPDVLVFSSEPLETELEVTGHVRVVLNAVSSAPSTDWVARLCDVHPDGRSFNLCDGILRVFEGADIPSLYEIDLWSTSNVFLPGHRIRVHVTSSSFPRWDRNLNTGDQDGTQVEVAHQRIFHESDRGSHIRLPVVSA